ncbi:ABC transporter substrate-binding protein [Pseudoalteromonas tunicata]|uniref:substrate-binding periplasmic protein n=1 Tax=Pseudoalteromonas tunicata TaxID=314281 RepID=UPI00273DF245|nr:ABC transporter substrate-binding protein [Pseudoalteromonas tunicata]MDP5212597.1 ABC transporter substrate-binding protein [Pseudoalteromonas tunicata]
MKTSFMQMFRVIFCFLITYFSIGNVLAASTEKTELIIGLGNFEPLFSEPDKAALFKDLIDGVFSYLPQYQLSYRYMLSNGRLEQALAEKQLDGAANIFRSPTASTCLTKPFFRFTDVAVSKKDKVISMKQVSQLANYSVVSYQNATTLLGDEYRNIVSHNQRYQEVSRPEQQALLLSQGLVDVSIGDKYIFLYSLKQLSKKATSVNEFDFHYIFPAGYTSMGFSRPSLCVQVNDAIDQFISSGGYEAVYQKHLITLGYDTQPLIAPQ